MNVRNPDLSANQARLLSATDFFGLASNPTRLEILLTLAQEKKPVRVSDLAKQVSVGAAAFSSHIAALVAGGLIERSRQGPKTYYALASNKNTKAIRRVVRMVEQGRWF